MNYKLSQKEVESVLKINIDKRVKYFRNMVGDKCNIWLCADNNGDLFTGLDKNNNKCLFVWPAKEYAEFLLTQTSLKAFKSINFLKSMDIHDFLDEYIDELIEQNIKIMIFPTENGGALMSAESFRNMMIEELLKYEDYEDDVS